MARAASMCHARMRLPTPSWRHWQWMVPALLKSPSLSTSRCRRPHQPAPADTKAISQNEYPFCSPSPLAGEGWDGGGRLGSSLRALRLSFTPTLALPRQGGGDRGGRIFARYRLSTAYGYCVELITPASLAG